MPLAVNKTWFTAEELKSAIEGLPDVEVFQSGVGCVSIENPVRRMDERVVPLEEIKKISAYCRANNIRLHLDGARIFMAAAWSAVSVKEYASYFDTIYISLYKYLGANAGAVLCGDKAVIEKMPHLIKIHGGNMFQNWTNAAMALHRLDGFENRLKEAIRRSAILFEGLNKIAGVSAKALDGGSNLHQLKLPKGMDLKVFRETLANSFIKTPRPDGEGNVLISINETLLYQDPSTIVTAFAGAIQKALAR